MPRLIVRDMMICCLMTSRIKGYPFEVLVSEEPPSAVLADQVRSLPAVLAEIQAMIRALLGL